MTGRERKATSNITNSNERSRDSDRLKKQDTFWGEQLPRWELVVCFAVWIGHSIYAWYAVYIASLQYKNQLYNGLFQPGWKLLGSRRQDVANYEWQIWSRQAIWFLPWYVGHAVLFNSTERLLGKMWKPVLVCYWMLAVCQVYSVGVLLVTFVFGSILYGVAQTKAKLLVWIAAVCLLGSLAMSQEWFPFYNPTTEVEREAIYEYNVFLAYKLLQFLSFLMHFIDSNSSPYAKVNHTNQAVELIFYTFYLPYTVTLIVLYKEFRHQIQNHAEHTCDYLALCGLALRVTFWAMCCEIIPHYFFCNAFMTDFHVLSTVGFLTLCAVGYTAGQYFQMKYMVIFGLPTFFAQVDRMEPPWPPICISRVALYSNMWRYFDRGLYSFMRDMIFVPLAAPSFSGFSRLVASALCFGFVWLWHGAGWAYFYWVSLNFLEVHLERLGAYVYKSSIVQGIVRRCSLLTVRRFVALLQVSCVAMGILSIFFFLGGVDTGNIFVDAVIFKNGLKLTYKFMWLIGLGYCFCQCCMELQRRDAP